MYSATNLKECLCIQRLIAKRLLLSCLKIDETDTAIEDVNFFTLDLIRRER